MSSGMKAAPLLADSTADPLGWRVANALAVAAPYLLAAAVFVVLYLQPPSPPAQAALSAPPPVSEAPAASLPTPAAAAASTMHPAAPAALKNAAATASGPTTPPATAPAAAASAAATTAPPAEKEPPLPTQPVPVDTAIARTMKLSGDPPQPSAAVRSAHLHGVVVVSAVVGPDGAVQSVQPVSGPALLELETLTAVRTWRYRPYLIYGKPVSFQTQVVIDFELDSSPQ